MVLNALTEIFSRDIGALKKEIESYNDNASIWKTKEGISNSAGNLCLHLVGNLSHFIGAVLGQTGYVREREKEFSLKDIPRSELIAAIEKTREVVNATLAALPPGALEKEYPLEMFGKKVKTDFMLLHLAAHLNYHLGQINYHRRLV